jgi:hypothetical protein
LVEPVEGVGAAVTECLDKQLSAFDALTYQHPRRVISGWVHRVEFLEQGVRLLQWLVLKSGRFGPVSKCQPGFLHVYWV